MGWTRRLLLQLVRSGKGWQIETFPRVGCFQEGVPQRPFAGMIKSSSLGDAFWSTPAAVGVAVQRFHSSSDTLARGKGAAAAAAASKGNANRHAAEAEALGISRSEEKHEEPIEVTRRKIEQAMNAAQDVRIERDAAGAAGMKETLPQEGLTPEGLGMTPKEITDRPGYIDADRFDLRHIKELTAANNLVQDAETTATAGKESAVPDMRQKEAKVPTGRPGIQPKEKGAPDLRELGSRVDGGEGMGEQMEHGMQVGPGYSGQFGEKAEGAEMGRGEIAGGEGQKFETWDGAQEGGVRAKKGGKGFKATVTGTVKSKITDHGTGSGQGREGSKVTKKAKDMKEDAKGAAKTATMGAKDSLGGMVEGVTKATKTVVEEVKKAAKKVVGSTNK